MQSNNIFTKGAVITALSIFSIELFIIGSWTIGKITKARNESNIKLEVKKFNQEKEKKKMLDELEIKKYLATGKNVYERIFNKQSQDIKNLLEGLAKESFPNEWRCEVKVEEFTNFILLAQISSNEIESSSQSIVKYIVPLAIYGNPYLKNIAIFDKKHICYLFFDEMAIEKIRKQNELSNIELQNAQDKGNLFKQYNSIPIHFEKYQGHIFLQVTISGNHGVMECPMLLDTGASMTVVSKEVAGRTGSLNKEDILGQRTFSTANGLLDCAIIKRKVSAGSIDKEQQVAVNLKDDTNLLGVDFFQNREYLIDTTSSSIFVWDK